MAKAEVKDGKLIYRDLIFKKDKPLSDIVWIYLQKEDAHAKMCCGSFNLEINRVIIVDKDMKRTAIEFEDPVPAKALIEEIRGADDRIAVGYTAENMERFGR